MAHAHLAPWAPGSNLAVCMNWAIDDRPRIQQEAICYQWFKQRLILSVSKPSISQRSAREFNLKAYAAITWHNDPASLGLEPRLADHSSHAGSAYRDATDSATEAGSSLVQIDMEMAEKYAKRYPQQRQQQQQPSVSSHLENMAQDVC